MALNEFNKIENGIDSIKEGRKALTVAKEKIATIKNKKSELSKICDNMSLKEIWEKILNNNPHKLLKYKDIPHGIPESTKFNSIGNAIFQKNIKKADKHSGYEQRAHIVREENNEIEFHVSYWKIDRFGQDVSKLGGADETYIISRERLTKIYIELLLEDFISEKFVDLCSIKRIFDKKKQAQRQAEKELESDLDELMDNFYNSSPRRSKLTGIAVMLDVLGYNELSDKVLRFLDSLENDSQSKESIEHNRSEYKSEYIPNNPFVALSVK